MCRVTCLSFSGGHFSAASWLCFVTRPADRVAAERAAGRTREQRRGRVVRDLPEPRGDDLRGRAGRDGDAWRYWGTADAAARRLGGYNHPWTMFGSANVKLHAVSISADLSRSGGAHSRAEQIDANEIPSRERRGRLGVELARAYHQRRDYPATLQWLETAYATSHDSVQYSPTARQMAADTVDHGGPLIGRRARSLAGSIGLPL